MENDLDLPEMKTITKSNIRQRWNKEHPNYNRQDQYHLLTRPEQVTIFNLRTGHNRLRQHMHSTYKAENTPDCRFCKQTTETTAHILQQCPSLSTLRCDIWDQPASLDKKLAGSLGDLKRTVQFIVRAGVSVGCLSATENEEGEEEEEYPIATQEVAGSNPNRSHIF